MSQEYLLGLSPDTVLENLPLVDYKVSKDTICKEVRDYFRANPTVPGVLITEGVEVKAMLSQRRLLQRLSRPYALDLFLKRPITELPELVGPPQEFLRVPGNLLIAEGLTLALNRTEEDTYEPLVVTSPWGECLLDVNNLLMAHARIFQMTVDLLHDQQSQTQTYLAKLEEQQAQIREYTVVLERQKTDWQERSQSLEAIQKQLLALAELLATQGGNAFQETFEGIDQIANQASQIVEDSGRLREETLQIQTINQVIGEIAARINLLAFNTTVESERAGPQAKGLSLLALEVRRLSGEATQATRKIQNITTAIAEYSERNVSSARGGAQVASDLKYKSQAAGRTLADLRSLLQELTESSKRLAEVEF